MEETYSEKLKRLTRDLINSSTEVDGILAELSQVAINREKAVNILETELKNLGQREKLLQKNPSIREGANTSR